MGFNIYEDVSAIPPTPSLQRGTDKHEAEQIFHQHAYDDVLTPGTAFSNVCVSIANAYPALSALKMPVLQGRAWEFFDANHDGHISVDEFIDGVEGLLRPSTAQGKALAERLQNSSISVVPSKGSDFSHVKKVAVVGAGVAGLQVANLLQQVGMTVTVFEKSQDVGGVWRENYADFGLQVPKDLYEFPGFPWPKGKDWELFPHGPQVQEYITLYAEKFGLNKLCKFETAVLELAPKPKARGWTVKHQKKDSVDVHEEDFDFCVVCSGMYGWPPHIPVARGFDLFKGEILHSCTFTDRRVAAGKKVVVVGGGKSAVDNAVAAAKEGVSSTLVCREAHWPVPRYLANLVPFKWGTYSRFGHCTLPAHHAEPPCFWWLHSTCAPMKWIWWRVVETMFKLQFKLPKEQVPTSRIESDLFNGGQILTYEFRDMCKSGQVQLKLGSIDRFVENGVVLIDGTLLEADMVVYATGFKKSYDLFDSATVQPLLNVEKDGLYLYRNIMPARLQDLAFVGCEVSTFNNILTHGLQAAWLQRVLTGSLKLPGPGGMEKSIEKDRAWKRSWMPPSSARASIWQLHMMKYHDILLKDMGEKYKRKGINFLAEVFAPYKAADYASLFKF